MAGTSGKRILKRTSALNGAYLLGTTNITLADGGACSVESLQQGDRVFTLAEPAQSSVVYQEVYPIDVTAPLVGFSESYPPVHQVHATNHASEQMEKNHLLQPPKSSIPRRACVQ